jgi:hypothetical integral membrane protein (TIGR02206 family)
MALFGAVHLSLLALIATGCVIAALLVRRGHLPPTSTRVALGAGLATNEIIWWVFRYSQEGIRFPENLPLHLCDLTLWATVIACLTLWRPAVEVGWFGGLAGAGMALLTPDLWSPWPSYPAVYFFLAHGGILIGMSAVVVGRMRPLEPGAVWRAFGVVLAYALAMGIFNAVFDTNYMYLCRKPEAQSLLDALGPWPAYLASSGVVALLLFWLLWLPVRPTADATSRR